MKVTNSSNTFSTRPDLGIELRTEAGLTLIEVIFAIAVLMFGVLALLQPLHFSALSLSNSRERAAALEIATSRMETIKVAPDTFFAQVPSAERPPLPLTGVWHHADLDLDYGEIADRPFYACYVLLDGNVGANNTAIVRIPVIWKRISGRFSTLDGEPFDPNAPDAHPAVVELRDVVRYR